MKTGGGSLRGIAGSRGASSSGVRVAEVQNAEALSADLAVGDVVRGVVRWVTADGAVGLDLMGRRVTAATDLPLGAGTTYEFTVLERGRRVVLAPARLLPLPPRAEALAGGWLGPPARETEAARQELRDENARRRASGAPQVWPLQVEAGGWLNDARLFVPANEDRAAAGGSFTIVLLLALEHLGALRVDAELRAASVHLRVTAERSETVDAVRDAVERLEEGLSADGISLRGIVFRHAGAAGLPVADLVAPPVERATATVDLHV